MVLMEKYTEPRNESNLGLVPESEYAPIKEKMNVVETILAER